MSQMPTNFQYVVTLDVVHFCGKRRTSTPEGIERRGTRAFRRFKQQAKAFLKSENRNVDAVKFSATPTVVLEDKVIATVNCDHWISNVVRSLPGVLILERAPVRRIPR